MSENSQRGFFSGWSKKRVHQFFPVFLGVALAIVFLSSTHPASAGIIPGQEEFKWAINWVLYGALVLFSWLASAAVTLFVYLVKPDFSIGFHNLAVTYVLWKFVRDFFNLFFILMLLFSAFATIFQVQQYHIRKLFLSILLAALLVNFSFPISRFIVDAANVPMYFFLNNALSNSQESDKAFGEILSASGLRDILVPPNTKDNFDTTDVSYMIMAVVFMFIFAITLVVLAIMFAIRAVALLILVIFSAVGFAATIVPGLGKYATQWWDAFTKYALFGPAAALMLLVAIKFMNEMGKSQAIKAGFTSAATNLSTPASTGFIEAMAFFSIPIILLWFAMGLASSFSIAGAGMVVGWGQKMAKGGLKRMTGLSWAQRNWAAYTGQRKKLQEKKSSFGKSLSNFQDTIHGKARFIPGSGDARDRVRDVHNKEIYEQVDANKKSDVSDAELKKQLLDGKDKVKAAAAAITLADRKAIENTDELMKAMAALGNNTKEISTLFEKASGRAVKGINAEQYGQIRSSELVQGNSALRNQIETQMKEKGNAKALIDYKLSTMGTGAETDPVKVRVAVEDTLRTIKSAKDVAKNESLFDHEVYGKHAADFIEEQGSRRVNAVKKASADEGTSVGNKLNIERAPDASEAARYRAEVEATAKAEAANERARQKAEAAARPGEKVSDGGIIIPPGTRSV